MNDNSVVTIDASSKTVAVDGVPFKVQISDALWMGLRAIRWNPAIAQWPGYVEYADGSGHGTRDYERVRPFVTGWEIAKATDDANRAIVQAHADADARRLKAEADARQAEIDASIAEQKRVIEASRPMNEALSSLAASDYRVLKAIEAKLLASGDLDPSVAAEREALRNVVRKARGE